MIEGEKEKYRKERREELEFRAMEERNRGLRFEMLEVAKHPNDPVPDCCPECKGELESGSGYVGEAVLYCSKCGIIVWEDSEDAIRRVV